MSPETIDAGGLALALLDAGGKGALLAAATLGALALLRRASAASRHLVLALTAGALVLLPALAALLPVRELAVLPARPAAESRERAGTAAEAPRAALATRPVAAVDRPDAALAAAVRRPLVAFALPGASLAVSALLLLRLAMAVRRLAALRGGALAAPAHWRDLFDDCRRRLGVTQEVALAVSPALAVPVTFGLRRPVVLLPPSAGSWEEPALRAALLHELAHVRRRDWPIQLIARAACALHWFDPLAWAVNRRLLLEAERACDDEVLRAGAGAAAYAGRLVALAGEVRRARRNLAAAVALVRAGGLAARVAAILDPKVRRAGPGPAAAAAAVAAAALLLLAVAPARVVRAEEREREREAEREREGESWVESIRAGLLEGRREALLELAADGEVEGLRVLLEAGADPDGWVPGDGTPLIAAAAAGQEEAVRVLLAAGADPNAPGPGDGSPLIAAAREGEVEIARLLLAAGADVDLVVDGDENPLIQAAWSGELEAVRLLLDAGADPNVRVVANRSREKPEGDLRTPLRMARRGGHPEIERLLRERGARD